MDFLAVLISILMIAVLIIVHEFGHFLAARHYGFQTPVFGIGLPIGPGIDLFKKWGTQFKFYFALIGGFVAIPELGDETDEETLKKYKLEKPLREFPVGQRAVVAVAGIVFNIIFAYLIAVVMSGTVGLPKANPNYTISAFVSDTSVAKKAGILVNDKIISINDIVIDSAKKLQTTIKDLKNQELDVLISRPVLTEGEELSEETPRTEMSFKVYSEGALGVMLGYDKVYEKKSNNPLFWIWDSAVFITKSLIAMFLGVIGLLTALVMKVFSILPGVEPTTGNLGEVKGIVGIVQLISQDIKQNAILLFEFAILLNLNLAVINLLPIPALDGGHLVFMAYEAIAKEKPSETVQTHAIQVGFIFLLSIILLTTFNDIKNWIFG